MNVNEKRAEIHAALAQIAAENSGLLTPGDVVAAAKKKDSVLHEMFEWDSAKAAHAWRLTQARDLIRSVKVVITNARTTVNTVFYVRDPDIDADQQGYVSVHSLIGDEERSRRALVDEFSRAAAALRRARELAIAFGLAEEIDAVVESLTRMETVVNSRVEHRAQ